MIHYLKLENLTEFFKHVTNIFYSLNSLLDVFVFVMLQKERRNKKKIKITNNHVWFNWFDESLVVSTVVSFLCIFCRQWCFFCVFFLLFEISCAVAIMALSTNFFLMKTLRVAKKEKKQNEIKSENKVGWLGLKTKCYIKM